MYNNVGRKIKDLASLLAGLGIFFSIIIGLIMFAAGIENNGYLSFMGIIFAVVGSIAAWLSALLLYAFGQLVDNSDIIVGQNNRVIYLLETKRRKANNFTPDFKQQNTQKEDVKTEENESDYFQNDYKEPDVSPVEHKWRCDFCGNMCTSNFCTVCGAQQPKK